MRTTFLALALALGAAVLPAPARAQGPKDAGKRDAEPKADGKKPRAPGGKAADGTLGASEVEAQRHFQAARDLYAQGAYRQAIVELEAARGFDPRSKELVFNLGVVHEKLADIPKALEFFRMYLGMDPDDEERARGEAYVRRLEGAKGEVAPKVVRLEAPKPSVLPPPPSPPVTVRGVVDGWTLVAAGATVVFVGAGTALGVSAVTSKPSSGFVTGKDGSYSDLVARTDSAHTQGVVADVFFGAGIAAAAATAILYFGRTRTEAPPRVTPLPVAGPGGAGVSFVGRF